MVEANITAAWPKHGLADLVRCTADALAANKYCFIWDKQGSVGTFMQYKAQLENLGPEIVKAALGRQTAADIGEFIRQKSVVAMRQGETLCFDIDTGNADFAAYSSAGTFDAELYFNWAEWAKEENYITYVRENENHSIGGLNPGHYIRSEKFNVCLRSGVSTEEELRAQIALIPRFATDFHCVIIE